MEYGITEVVKIEGIKKGFSVDDENGNRILIIVENIIDDIALIKCIDLRSNRRVTEISFQRELIITDLDLLFRVENNHVVISQIQSTTLQSLAFRAKKNAIEQVMV